MIKPVETLYSENCRQIPAMLRQSADNIAGEEAEGFARTTAMIAVRLTENGQIDVYGWGDTNDFHAAGMLHFGLTEIARIRLDIPVDRD